MKEFTVDSVTKLIYCKVDLLKSTFTLYELVFTLEIKNIKDILCGWFLIIK